MTPESTGLNIALDIIVAFIDTIISAIGDFLITDLMGGLFAVFIDYLFGGGLSVELAFSLMFALFLFGFFWKYVYNVVN